MASGSRVCSVVKTLVPCRRRLQGCRGRRRWSWSFRPGGVLRLWPGLWGFLNHRGGGPSVLRCSEGALREGQGSEAGALSALLRVLALSPGEAALFDPLCQPVKREGVKSLTLFTPHRWS